MKNIKGNKIDKQKGEWPNEEIKRKKQVRRNYWSNRNKEFYCKYREHRMKAKELITTIKQTIFRNILWIYSVRK